MFEVQRKKKNLSESEVISKRLLRFTYMLILPPLLPKLDCVTAIQLH